MYKVIIIDDEPVIVQGLTRSIKWDQYDCEVAGTASSGAEGLQLMEQEQPDLVFSDIRMPHMDGLSMIAAAKSIPDISGRAISRKMMSNWQAKDSRKRSALEK